MAWIEVHQHLKEHRKTRKLKNLMGVTRAQAMGHLVMLWLWGIDNTDDYGIIQDADHEDIAIACDYHGDSQVIINSLIEAGFLEKEASGKLFIHDFEDYIGKLRAHKKRHREAQKRYAEKSKSNTNDDHADSHADGQADSPNDGLKIANLTVPYLTVPSPIPKKDIEDFFDSAWKLYPKKEGKGQVSKTQKDKLYKIGIEEIGRAVARYIQSKEGTDKKFLQNGSTFFNSGYIDYMDDNYKLDVPTREGTIAW